MKYSAQLKQRSLLESNTSHYSPTTLMLLFLELKNLETQKHTASEYLKW